MSDRKFPQLDQIRSFKKPISEEMIGFIKYLDSQLIDGIELYIRPFLNEDQPDLVIFNPKKGIMFYNELSWKSGTFIQEKIRTKMENPMGYGKVNVDHDIFKNMSGEEIANPIKHIRSLCDNLVQVYVPEIAHKLKKNYIKNCAVGLFLPNFNQTSDAMNNIRIVQSKARIVANDYKTQNINNIITYLNDKPNVWPEWKEEWAEKIKFYLIPPLHKIEDGIKINLSSDQERNIKHEPNTHRRLRGVAGSGKTLVIAQKAANIASQNKKVLIVTFNITLMQYILEQIKRSTYKFKWENIIIKHFHGFSSEFLRENGVPWPSGGDTEAEETIKLNEVIPKLVSETIKSGKNINNRIYDAIIIDEGQDFIKSWYDCLCLFLSDNDEIFYVVDNKQNVYKRENRWIDQMEGGGKFNKRWREMDRSFRLPKLITKKVNQFAKLYLENDDSPLIDDKWDLGLFEPHVIWNNFNRNSDLKEIVYKYINFLTKEKNIHLEDIIVMVPTHAEGFIIAKYLEQNKIYPISHIFRDPRGSGNSKIKKIAFKMDFEGLKLSTLHSFKGWEIPTVILITPYANSDIKGKSDQLIYMGLTRARSNLIVLNKNKRYHDFGESWPQDW